jgi:hypothetical protein
VLPGDRCDVGKNGVERTLRNCQRDWIRTFAMHNMAGMKTHVHAY